MFDLKEAIAEWRQQMLTAGIKTPAPLEELESHLREDIERQMQSGLSAEKAFESAARKIGRVYALQTEFAKVGGVKKSAIPERLKQYFLTLAGIPNPQLATNMNTTSSNSEPRWAAYAKAGTFLFPALFLWLITAVFVLPKANELCQAAGTTVFNFSQPVPAIIKAWSTIGQALIFLTSHFALAGSVIVLAFVLLERYSRRWPRYRRAALGSGAFLFNAVILLSLTLMMISILVAAPALTLHIK